MVALSYNDKERVYHHLGYGVSRLGKDGSLGGIDAADLAQVEEATENLTSEYMKLKLKEQLDVLDVAEEYTRIASDSAFSTKEIFLGDVNRTIRRFSLDDMRRIKRNYLDETDKLARMLAVTNYQHDYMNAYRFERGAGAYINSIPGVADTAVSSRRLEYKQLVGGFGF